MFQDVKYWNKYSLRRGILALLFLVALGSLVSISYAQIVGRNAFSLNSPVSFPVDI